MLYYERKLKKAGYNLIIGVDEAGRGPLAGPVVAAAVALKKLHFKNRVDDSKKLTALQRENVFPEIINNSIFGLGVVDEKIIDRLNILVATRLSMKKAIASLIDKLNPDHQKQKPHLLIDGNMDIDIDIPTTYIIKGDSKSVSIAAASILAKVTRDRIMSVYDRMYPQYGFIQHKGYPTAGHKAAIRKFGLSIIHRKTFCFD